MSYSSLGKKLGPAKKALKRISSTLESKLHNLNFSKAFKMIKTNTNRLLAYCSRHFFLPFKKRSLTKPKCCSRQYNHLYNKTLQLHNNNTFSSSVPIYIDNLYAAEPSLHFHAHAETSNRGNYKDVSVEKVVVPKREGKAREKSVCSIEDAWRQVVARSPQLRPVDERAEEFIYKFRQEIKLQKDKSILEFEERLARSA